MYFEGVLKGSICSHYTTDLIPQRMLHFQKRFWACEKCLNNVINTLKIEFLYNAPVGYDEEMFFPCVTAIAWNRKSFNCCGNALLYKHLFHQFEKKWKTKMAQRTVLGAQSVPSSAVQFDLVSTVSMIRCQTHILNDSGVTTPRNVPGNSRTHYIMATNH